MQHQAWLVAVPRDPQDSQVQDRRTRRERLAIDPEDLTWPEVSAPWLLGYLFEAGPASQGGMSLAPLSWGEIRAWSHLTATPISPEEARLLRHLSSVYAAALHASADPAQPPYWTCPVLTAALEEQRQAREQAISLSLSALAHQANNP